MDTTRNQPECYILKSERLSSDELDDEWEHLYPRVLAELSGSWFERYLECRYIGPEMYIPQTGEKVEIVSDDLYRVSTLGLDNSDILLPGQEEEDEPVRTYAYAVAEGLSRAGYSMYEGPWPPPRGKEEEAYNSPLKDGWEEYARRYIRTLVYDDACKGFRDEIDSLGEVDTGNLTVYCGRFGTYRLPDAVTRRGLKEKAREVTSTFVDRYKKVLVSRIDIRYITTFTPQWSVSLTDLPVPVLPARYRYLLDMGTVKTYSITFTRVPPEDADDLSYDNIRWTNAKWISYFRDFFDVWQNSTYNPEGKRSGGFELHFIPPDESCFPKMTDNFFLVGSANIDYDINIESVNLNLTVASMLMGEGVRGKAVELRYDYLTHHFSDETLEDVSYTFPQFPYSWLRAEPNLIWWVSRNSTVQGRWYPGQTVDWTEISEIAVYGFKAEAGKYVSSMVARPGDYSDTTFRIALEEYMDGSEPTDRFAVVLVGGGGGAGEPVKQDVIVTTHLRGLKAPLYSPRDFGNYVTRYNNPTVGGGGGAGQVTKVPGFIQGGEHPSDAIGTGFTIGRGGCMGESGGYTSITVSGITYSAKGGSPGTRAGGGTQYNQGGAGGTIPGKWWYNSTTNDEHLNLPSFGDGQSTVGEPGKGTPYGAGGGAADLNMRIHEWKDGRVSQVESDLKSRGGSFYDPSEMWKQPDPSPWNPVESENGYMHNTFRGSDGGGGGSFIDSRWSPYHYNASMGVGDQTLGAGGDGLIIIHRYSVE